MKCCCDVDLPIVRKAFAKRNWTEVEPHQDWNIYWTSVANARCLMAPDSNTRLSDNQRVNHFPTHYELTRKDLLARHMQRYQRQRSRALQRDEPPPPAIVPSTYVLPRDYSMFVDEYKKRAGGGSSLWIVKPCGKAQGIGIKLVNRPSQVKSLINRYRKGFCRFCQLHYRTKGLDNPFVHLTNVSVQRHGGRYNQSHGGKWSLSSLETFVRGTRGSASAARLRQDLRELVAHSLTAVAPSMLSDWHCFECYGYDVLLDEDLRPWLLEVNASPSLTSSTRADALLKQALVDDVLRLVAPSGKPSSSAYSEADLGDFEQILPAAQTPLEEEENERTSWPRTRRIRSGQ
ncbi:polyglutamylase complex subunit TTLL1 isoform X2 [Dermacentor andersoni]|uniref:polyglutamylase complex subunit TTLL1 isoform X2 n=1 Tax=Dermacentor andersoni TaxID=34620 RepID=UPI003B3B0681